MQFKGGEASVRLRFGVVKKELKVGFLAAGRVLEAQRKAAHAKVDAEYKAKSSELQAKYKADMGGAGAQEAAEVKALRG